MWDVRTLLRLSLFRTVEILLFRNVEKLPALSDCILSLQDQNVKFGKESFQNLWFHSECSAGSLSLPEVQLPKFIDSKGPKFYLSVVKQLQDTSTTDIFLLVVSHHGYINGIFILPKLVRVKYTFYLFV